MIINTISLVARQAGGPGSAIYGASKAFAQSPTRYLARDYAHDNIRVNAVALGFVMTPFARALHDAGAAPGDGGTACRWVAAACRRTWSAPICSSRPMQ